MLRDKISKIDGLTLGLINYIITPVLYLSMLLPLVRSGKISAVIFLIMMLVYNTLFIVLFMYVERRK